MSADNWAVCPACKRRAEETVVALAEKANAAYGDVPFDEYEQMRAVTEAAAFERDNLKPTFREDYEITGAETGFVHVSYGGRCQVCRVELTFEVDRPIDVTAVNP